MIPFLRHFIGGMVAVSMIAIGMTATPEYPWMRPAKGHSRTHYSAAVYDQYQAYLSLGRDFCGLITAEQTQLPKFKG